MEQQAGGVMRFISIAAVAFLAVVLSGCTGRYPLGMAESEWLALPAEEKLQARKQQAELDEARALQHAAEAQARAEQQIRHEVAREVARENAVPGGQVQCLLTGKIRAGGEWREAGPAWIDVVAGWAEDVVIRSNDARFAHYAYAAFDGVTIRVCPTELDLEWGASGCAELSGTPQSFRRGVSGRGEIERVWRGAMQCELPLDHY